MTGPSRDTSPVEGPAPDTRPVVVGVADAVPVAADLDVAGLRWRTATYATGKHPDSLEVVAVPGGGLAIRNGRFPDRGVVTCSQRAWTALARALMVGEHLVRL